jgi:hypothetical protein
LSSNSEGRLIAPSARSGGLDDVDGSPDCRVYSESRSQRQGGSTGPHKSGRSAAWMRLRHRSKILPYGKKTECSTSII